MSTAIYHTPVLLQETLEFLALRDGALVADGTVGGGGHAEAILEATAPDGQLLGLDLDEEALEAAGKRLARFAERVQLIQASFRNLREICREQELARLDGVLLDLGVSSHQLDASDRGFRFSGEESEQAPLDMRMDRRAQRTAAELLRTASHAELVEWLRRYGELPGATRLTTAVIETRRTRPLRTAGDLLHVIREARVGGGRRHHPATLVFQALRIAVNDELHALEEGLDAAVDCLAPGGRLVVIAYHSLEDRIVKRHLRDAARGCICPPRMPRCICGRTPKLRVLTRRVVRPSEAETRANPRSRSARLRAAERLQEAA